MKFQTSKRSVRIRKDRSITLYKGLGLDRVKHDGLRERIRYMSRYGDPEREGITRLQTELDARLAGNPTEGFTP